MAHTQWSTLVRLCLAGALLTMGTTACTVNTLEAPTAQSAAVTPTATDAEADAIERPEGWSEETHGDDADPNYDVVFAQDRVHPITITIAPQDWEAMQANMVALFGQAGSGNQGRDFDRGMAPPEGGRAPALPGRS